MNDTTDGAALQECPPHAICNCTDEGHAEGDTHCARCGQSVGDHEALGLRQWLRFLTLHVKAIHGCTHTQGVDEVLAAPIPAGAAPSGEPHEPTRDGPTWWRVQLADGTLSFPIPWPVPSTGTVDWTRPAPSDDPPPRLLRPEEVAERLSVSRSMVWKLVSEGGLRATRIGKSVRISEAVLAQFIADHTDPDPRGDAVKRWHYVVLVIVAPACLLVWWAIDPLGNLLRWLDEQRTPFEDRGWDDDEPQPYEYLGTWTPSPGGTYHLKVGTTVRRDGAWHTTSTVRRG